MHARWMQSPPIWCHWIFLSLSIRCCWNWCVVATAICRPVNVIFWIFSRCHSWLLTERNHSRSKWMPNFKRKSRQSECIRWEFGVRDRNGPRWLLEWPTSSRKYLLGLQLGRHTLVCHCRSRQVHCCCVSECIECLCDRCADRIHAEVKCGK